MEFELSSDEIWVGNFKPGLGGITDAQRHPNGRDVLVIASGNMMDVQPEIRVAVPVRSPVVGAWRVPASGDLIFDWQGLAFFRYGSGGLVWHTRRVSWVWFPERQR